MRIGDASGRAREGRREADAGIGCVGRHAVRIVAAEGDGRPLVRGTPYGG
jgi:hypothetical protein